MSIKALPRLLSLLFIKLCLFKQRSRKHVLTAFILLVSFISQAVLPAHVFAEGPSEHPLVQTGVTDIKVSVGGHTDPKAQVPDLIVETTERLDDRNNVNNGPNSGGGNLPPPNGNGDGLVPQPDPKKQDQADYFLNNLDLVLDQIKFLEQALKATNERNLVLLGPSFIDELKRRFNPKYVAKDGKDYIQFFLDLYDEKSPTQEVVREITIKLFENMSDEEFRKTGADRWNAYLDDVKLNRPTELARIGFEKFRQMVIRGEVKDLRVDMPGIGKAEPSSINGFIVPQIVHERTGIVVGVIDERIDTESPHFKQWAARKHMDANHTGRHYMLLRKSRIDIEWRPEDAKTYTLEFKPKLKASQMDYWREWKDATITPPDKGSILLAGVMVALQTGISKTISIIKEVVEKKEHDAGPAMVLSAIFGSIIGTYISSFKHFWNRGTRIERVIKRGSVSVLFGYMLQAWQHGGLEAFSLFDVSGLSLHAALWINVFVNNYGKDYTLELPRMLEAKGGDDVRGYFKFRVPFTRKMVKTPIRYSQLTYQLVDLFSYSLKMADFIAIGIVLPIVGSIALGKLALWTSPIWAQYLVLKYAEHIKSDRAPELRKKWNDFKQLGPVKRTASTIWGGLKSAYDWAFGKQDNKDTPLASCGAAL